MEKTMALMTQKRTEPGTSDSAQGPWYLPAAYWKTSESYAKHHTYKFQ